MTILDNILNNINFLIIFLFTIAILYGIYKGFTKIVIYIFILSTISFFVPKLQARFPIFATQETSSLLMLFGLVFLIFFIFILITNHYLSKFFEENQTIKVYDKIAGALFMLFLATILIGIIYQLTFEIAPQCVNDKRVVNSKVVQPIYKFDVKLYSFLPKNLQKKIKDFSPHEYATQYQKRLHGNIEQCE